MKEEMTWKGMVWYCKDCEKAVQVSRVGKKYTYQCLECKSKNVCFGTDKSIKNFFHIKEETKTP